MNAEPCSTTQLEALYAFVEGRLDEVSAERIRLHAERCETCRRQILDAMQLQNMSHALSRNRMHARDFERIERWTQETLASLQNVPKTPGNGSDSIGRD